MAIDSEIFNLITVTLKNGFFDYIMPILSDAKLWRIPLLVVIVSFFVFGKKKGSKTVLLCLLAVAISDFICGGILQPFINRPRPLGGVTPSFPSCHAANMFAAATAIYYIWRKLWVGITVFTLALAVGYSRVYTTSHYPTDVLGGMIIGTILSLLVIYIFNLVAEKIKAKKSTN